MIGIIGAGQLGRMLALAGYPLGLNFRFLDRSADTPGGQVAPISLTPLDALDKQPGLNALLDLARASDVLTFDWENVPAEALTAAAEHTKVLPPPAALAVSQDRLLEKELFRKLKIPTPEFAAVDTHEELVRAVTNIGAPGVLKTRRMGYDGKGQFVLRKAADIDAAWNELGGQALIYEAFVSFTREVSVIGVRSTHGEVKFYPLCANTHSQGILHYTTAPYAHAGLQKQAQLYLSRLLKYFNYAGVLTLELFVVRGKLLANEMAPRVHNSGHWTIEGAVTSQFENHLRAITGLPLGSTAPVGHSAMLNYVGHMPAAGEALRVPGLHFHHYGKEARPRRKLGHCTLVETSAARRDARLKKLLK